LQPIVNSDGQQREDACGVDQRETLTLRMSAATLFQTWKKPICVFTLA